MDGWLIILAETTGAFTRPFFEGSTFPGSIFSLHPMNKKKKQSIKK
jgi:hypothetical protein